MSKAIYKPPNIQLTVNRRRRLAGDLEAGDTDSLKKRTKG